MKRKLKGSVIASAVLFLTSGVMASVLGVRQYDRATSEMSWVASAPVQAGQILTAELIKQSRVKSSEVGIKNPRQLIGKRLKSQKDEGETFSAGDFEQSPRSQRRSLAEHIPQGRVLYTLKLGANASVPFSQLNKGDRLDILVTGKYGVRTAATDVKLIGLMKSGGGKKAADNDTKITSLLPQRKPESGSAPATTLVLAVEPSHVYPLASIGSKDFVSLVLHSAYDVAMGKTVSVTPRKTQRAVELVSGLDRTQVFVKQ